MLRFVDLIDPFVHTKTSEEAEEELARFISERNDRLDQGFWERVHASNFQVWSLGDPVPSAFARLLLGTWVASTYDLVLLDQMQDWLQSGTADPTVSVQLFETSKIMSHEAFELWVPGAAPVYHMPVVGRWEVGALVARGNGFAGREIAKQFMRDHTLAPPSTNR
jgi:hypothetical protein